MKKYYVLALSFLLSVACYSQEKTEKRQYIGIGIRSSVFHISELPVRVIPPNRLLVNVDPVKFARVEFHCGYYKNIREQTFSVFPGTYRILKFAEKSSIYGGGVFGILPKENFRFILGARYSINNYSQDDVNFDSGGNPYVITNSGKINIVSGVLGCEYNFSKLFSVGAEFSFIRMSDKYTPADKTMPALTSTTNISESSLVFRFYPY
jgi:hypothetical protein